MANAGIQILNLEQKNQAPQAEPARTHASRSPRSPPHLNPRAHVASWSTLASTAGTAGAHALLPRSVELWRKRGGHSPSRETKIRSGVIIGRGHRGGGVKLFEPNVGAREGGAVKGNRKMGQVDERCAAFFGCCEYMDSLLRLGLSRRADMLVGSRKVGQPLESSTYVRKQQLPSGFEQGAWRWVSDPRWGFSAGRVCSVSVPWCAPNEGKNGQQWIKHFSESVDAGSQLRQVDLVALPRGLWIRSSCC